MVPRADARPFCRLLLASLSWPSQAGGAYSPVCSVACLMLVGVLVMFAH